MAARIELTLYRNEERSWHFTLQYKITRLGINLLVPVARALTATVRESVDLPAAIVKTIGAGITLRNQTLYPGEFDVAFDAADSTALALQDFEWDLLLDAEVVVAPSRFRLAYSPTLG